MPAVPAPATVGVAGGVQAEARAEPRLQESSAGWRGPKMKERGQWANKYEFILAMAGATVGLGNMWRFSYLCYKNGGGAFLVPYTLFMLGCGVPLVLLETAMGQFRVGYTSQVILVYGCIYYIVVLAWAFFYLFSSFSSELPWASCGHTWNTDTCLEMQTGRNASNSSIPGNSTSPVQEFWERRVLGVSGGIDEVGGLRWELALCLFLAWTICYFCVWKGVKTTGKVVYFTATFPYVMLLALLVRGLTLPGAADGLLFYLSPDPTRLADPQVWMDAGSQILLSYGISVGVLKSLGSYNKYHNDCFKDTFGLCLLNSTTSLLFGVAIFSVLGFMAQERNLEVSEVAQAGPGLAFLVYPSALVLMPFPQLWSICFFLTIILLGVDSQFVCLETLAQGFVDVWPSVLRRGWRQELLLLLLSLLCFLVGLLLVTEGGVYLFQIFDYYSYSGFILLLIATFHCVGVGWVYGADRFYDNIQDMIGYRPWPLIKYCWRYLTPAMCTGTCIFSLVKYTPVKYNSSYVYPGWAYELGWCLALSSVPCVPVWMIYRLSRTAGPLRQVPPTHYSCCNSSQLIYSVEPEI
ncbi:S6A13 protein, partial [Amia calva]|nr:S6A13 protein [Amia calva]